MNLSVPDNAPAGPYYLSSPGVVSALGSGIADTVTALLAGGAVPLTVSGAWIPGRHLPLGQVKVALRPFPADVADAARSHNNHLLWHAAAQIEPALHQVVQRFGAGRVGVVLGTSTSGVDENLPAFRHVVQGGRWQDSGFSQAHQLLSSPVDFIMAQYGLAGPGFCISTACTSGARALISAARLLQLGVCDAVLCGGVDCLSLLTIHGFGALEVLSDEVARPFAADRDGINIGEAAALFVMTRDPLGGMSGHAGEDDTSLALLGYGASSDAWHMSSPRPDGAGAIQSIRQALSRARLDGDCLGWVNLHGTGTPQNDAMESLAIHQCLGGAVPATSTKPYAGHTLGAAGALEAAIVWGVASRRINPEGRLPAQSGGYALDPDLPAIALARPGSCWPVDGRRAGLSTSFAFGGNNTALVIGETA